MMEITIPAYSPTPEMARVPEYVIGQRSVKRDDDSDETLVTVVPVSKMRQLLALTADNPVAVLAINHHKEITKDYKQFIQYADGGLKHLMAVIGGIADCIVEPEDEDPFLPRDEYEFVDGCAVTLQRLFGNLLGIKTVASVDYEHALYQAGNAVRNIRHDDAAVAVDQWIANLPSNGTYQRPFTAHTYKGRRKAAEEYIAFARVSAGSTNLGEFEVKVHTPKRTFDAHAVHDGTAVPGSTIKLTAAEKIPTGSLITREEQPRVETVSGIVKLSAYDFGGPRRQLYSGASLNAFIGGLSSHAAIKLPVGVGKLMPGGQEHGVKLSFINPLPAKTGDKLTLTVSSERGARFCGEMEIAKIH